MTKTAEDTRQKQSRQPEEGWQSGLSRWVNAFLLYELISGLLVTFAAFGGWIEINLLLHTALGVLFFPVLVRYAWRHWQRRRGGRLNHYQLLGYGVLVLVLACVITGFLVTWQGLVEIRMSVLVSRLHLFTGIAVGIVLLAHWLTLILRKQGKADRALATARARRGFWRVAAVFTLGLVVLAGVLGGVFRNPPKMADFASSYNWRFGKHTPFLPSLAAIEDDTGKVVAKAANPLYLTRSKSCGQSGCHQNIYREWLPSAHRYSGLDTFFQGVQKQMVTETSPEHTRYCAGCHDPVSLYTGAKDSANITLSGAGTDEGSSCAFCHSVVKTDIQGNGNYTLQVQDRYLFEFGDDGVSRLLSDFLIRTYPEQHRSSYARPLYKTTEFCAACHKQYLDKMVNTDIGKVQGQNQYDNWKNSHWYHRGNPRKTVSCRECHLPLVASADPANGDVSDYNRSANDGKHRSHRTLGSNQYMPLVLKLKGAKKQAQLIKKWLQGKYEIPEIADKWVKGPVVKMRLTVPRQVYAGAKISLTVQLTDNKAGHDFPTGPLDMIESWLEVTATDSAGRVIFHQGGIKPDASIEGGAQFRADAFDRQGKRVNRHNLWDLVGASYKRTLFPGRTDGIRFAFQYPALAGAKIDQSKIVAVKGGPDAKLDGTARRTILVPVKQSGARTSSDLSAGPALGKARYVDIEVKLMYRKSNPEFLRVVMGGKPRQVPTTVITRAHARVEIQPRSQLKYSDITRGSE